MPILADYKKHVLKFKFDAGTSRGILKEKTTFFIRLKDANTKNILGVGECGPLVGLSIDDRVDFEENLNKICAKLCSVELPPDTGGIFPFVEKLVPVTFPSIRFGLETALLDYIHGGKHVIFNNSFSESGKGIAINGLVWMGDVDFMIAQIQEKVAAGFSCIKLKIGALDFEKECAVLKYIREVYAENDLILRVDANGAFKPEEALEKIQRLAEFNIHSIEQPIRQGQVGLMSRLCQNSPLPIALDEELIGINKYADKVALLEQVMPQYIIIKPTLVGGIKSSEDWIEIAESFGIGWWVTSALESNVGLNAISQFTGNYALQIPHGLGTGQLYDNNISSPLTIHNGYIVYDGKGHWDSSIISAY